MGMADESPETAGQYLEREGWVELTDDSGNLRHNVLLHIGDMVLLPTEIVWALAKAVVRIGRPTAYILIHTLVDASGRDLVGVKDRTAARLQLAEAEVADLRTALALEQAAAEAAEPPVLPIALAVVASPALRVYLPPRVVHNGCDGAA